MQLSAWPDLTDEACDKAVDILNQAAGHWYRADGNWYKIFKALDVEENGELKFDDFVRLCAVPIRLVSMFLRPSCRRPR